MQNVVKNHIKYLIFSLLFFSLAGTYVSVFNDISHHKYDITHTLEDNVMSHLTDLLDEEKLIPQTNNFPFPILSSIRYSFYQENEFDSYSFFYWQPPQQMI